VKIKVALGQMRITGNVDKNLEKIKALVVEAKRKRADVICFPECALSGYGPIHYQSPGELNRKKMDAAHREIRKLARARRIAIVLGTSLYAKDRWQNVALFVTKSGRLAGIYTKAHLTSGDKEFYAPGQEVKTFAFLGMRVGCQICLDQRFPELFRVLALKGAKIIFHPLYTTSKKTLWKRPVIDAHMRSRAAENSVFIVTANRASITQNSTSCIYDPNGVLVARSRLGSEDVVVGVLDFSKKYGGFIKNRRRDLADLKYK
jgi:NAD+ synthase (glutamine-hydrolysing)